MQEKRNDLRITIFIGSISGGGAERMCCNLANFLASHGHEVCVLTMSEAENTYNLSPKVKQISLINNYEKKNILFDNYKRFIRLGRYMKHSTNDCYLVMLPITIILMLLHRNATQSPIIASERNNPKSYNGIVRFLLRKLAKRADAWVFQTESARDWYEGIIKESTVIPNAINQEFIRPTYTGIRNNEIVAVGRLDRQKNYPLLIEAFKELHQIKPEVILKIFGKGPEEKTLKEKVQSLGLSDSITFMGYVSNIYEQIEKSRLFVMTSDYEGMPNSLMEAMSLGLPCISTDCPSGGPRYLIQDKINGLLINVGNKKALVDAMLKILNDLDFSKRLSINATKIQERLNPNKIYSSWKHFIESFTNEIGECSFYDKEM